MKRYQTILMALMAMFAVAATTAGTASAETTLLAEWLIGGNPVMTLTPVETSGEALLATLVLGVEVVKLLCSGISDGSVGANGEGEVTEVLSLTHVLIGKELAGTALSCEVEVSAAKECGTVGELAEIWIDNLPAHGLLELMETTGQFLGLALGSPGIHVLCPGGKENLCEGPSSAILTNVTGGVQGESNFTTSESVACTVGTGDAEGTALTTATGGGTLTVSE